MKIVYLHQYFLTPQMSGGTRSYEIARRLVRSGHEVHMVTADLAPDTRQLGQWRETQEAGINVHWLGLPYSNAMNYAERMRAFLKFAWASAQRAAQLGGDVIFATSTPLTIALPAVYAARRSRAPMVFEVRDLWPEVPIALGAIRHPLLVAAARRLERFAYDNARRVVALSPDMKAGVVRVGYPEAQVAVIPNSCDLELFDVPAERGEEVRRRHAWLGQRPLVVYTGMLGLANGVDYLARVAASVAALDPEIRFLVIGAGREAEKVRQAAQALNVLERNFFMLPSVPKTEMPAWFSAASLATSLFINVPALWSNSANKFFDALAAGRPVAINYGGWQADLLHSSGAGLVLPPEQPEQAARDMVALLRDPERRRQAGAAARELARTKFSRDALAQELESILRQAVQKA